MKASEFWLIWYGITAAFFGLVLIGMHMGYKERIRQVRQKEVIEIKKDNKAPFSKFIVSFIFVTIIMFTLAILFIFLRTGSEPSTLVASFFGIMAAEFWALAFIKNKDTEKEIQIEKDDDEC